VTALATAEARTLPITSAPRGRAGEDLARVVMSHHDEFSTTRACSRHVIAAQRGGCRDVRSAWDGHYAYPSFLPAWKRKVRVGANSPTCDNHRFVHEDRDVTTSVVHGEGVSDHVGITVERRLQVLMTFFSFAAFIASTFFKGGIDEGPFLRLRDILYLLRAPRHGDDE